MSKITKFKPKSIAVEAVQFDGTNAAELKKWIRKDTPMTTNLTNSKYWFKISDYNIDTNSYMDDIAKVGDFIVRRTFESLPDLVVFIAMPKEQFLAEYTIPKSYTVI